jgi:hypothetical protein
VPGRVLRMGLLLNPGLRLDALDESLDDGLLAIGQEIAPRHAERSSSSSSDATACVTWNPTARSFARIVCRAMPSILAARRWLPLIPDRRR